MHVPILASYVQREMSDGWARLWLGYYHTPLYDDDGNPLLYELGVMKGKPKYQIKHAEFK